RPSATTRPFGNAQQTPASEPRFVLAAPAQMSSAVEETVVRATPAPSPTAPAASAPADDDRTLLRAPRTLSPEAPQTPAPPADAPSSAPEKRRSRTGLWIGLAAVAIVAVVAGVIGINRIGGSGDEPDPVATQDEGVPQYPRAEAVPQVDERVG